MASKGSFRVLVYDLEAGRGDYETFGNRAEILGGSGLAAALFEAHRIPDAPALDPRQPLIFAIGPLTGCFPLMSKAICAFASPYHGQYAETHGGGRLALAMRFAHIDALVVRGRAAKPSCLVAGIRRLQLHDCHPLWGMDVFATGKQLRRMFRFGEGHRSILRIGPAGENGVAYASVNVDTYRHFGRLGAGAIMGSRNLKAIVIDGGSSLPTPPGRDYRKLYKKCYDEVTGPDLMRKYHDLGTAENLAKLNAISALPWDNMKRTRDDAIDGVSGERFAKDQLLRQTACAGCPVGCIHVGLMRERFGEQHEYLYRQVSYDYEPIFAAGTMLGLTDAAKVLTLIDEIERQGLDVMSAGVALGWATEALERGDVGEAETIAALRFGDLEGYMQAVGHLAARANPFYRSLGQGTLVAAKEYGGEDYACVLGQEMAGYATGEAFFVSQALGLRHSHLDSAGYTLDQQGDRVSVEDAVDFLIEDERKRVLLTSMAACLFARSAYPQDRLAEALAVMGYDDIAGNLGPASKKVQALRWRVRFASGFEPGAVTIPKRFREVRNARGPIDTAYLGNLRQAYQQAITGLAA